jgi:AcrR family transcriptional regulator
MSVMNSLSRPTKFALTPSDGPPEGSNVRTYAKLLNAAMKLVGKGFVPSISELAVHSEVSRATAYRCFPNRSRLISAVVNKSLGDVRKFDAFEHDGKERLHELFEATFSRFAEFEPQLRAALQLALEHEAKAKAGLLEEEQYRRGYRVAILDRAAKPLEAEIGKKSYKLLTQALSVIYGIEPYVVMRDIAGMTTAEIEKTTFWMMDALIEKALKDKDLKDKSK